MHKKSSRTEQAPGDYPKIAASKYAKQRRESISEVCITDDTVLSSGYREVCDRWKTGTVKLGNMLSSLSLNYRTFILGL